MRQKSAPAKEPAEKVVKEIRRATRRQFSAEEKIRIVLEGACAASTALRNSAGVRGSSRTYITAGRKIFLRPVRSGSLAIRRGPQPRTRSRTFAARHRL